LLSCNLLDCADLAALKNSPPEGRGDFKTKWFYVQTTRFGLPDLASLIGLHAPQAGLFPQRSAHSKSLSSAKRTGRGEFKNT
jgi:hypothetical protein